jgi:hypothetical protein
MILKDDIHEEERWLKEMLALSRQISCEPEEHKLSHDELLIRDFINGEGIFAEGH